MEKPEKSLKELIDSGRLPADTKLTHTRNGIVTQASVTSDGVRIGAVVYPSVSLASLSVGRTGGGWVHWKMENGSSLADLRADGLIKQISAYLADHPGASGREIGRALGKNDDRAIRAAWDRGHLAGLLPARPVSKPAGEPAGAKPARKRPVSWNGMSNAQRQREIREMSKAADGYGDLVRFQIDLNRATRALEGWNGFEDLKLDEVASWKVSDIHDDLVSLGVWYYLTLASVQRWIDRNASDEKIAKLENVSGRTPEEAEAYLRLAARLRKQRATAGIG